MMKKPLISIILPVYNGEIYVGKTIESILNQSFQDFELIIVDDGSTDNSKVVIDQFDDGRIVYIHEVNQGICSARNTGLRNSKANYIMFCDHDDEYLPGYLSEAKKYIQDSTIDFIKFGCRELYIHDQTLVKERHVRLDNHIYEGREVRKLLYAYADDNEYIWDGIYKKEKIIEAGMFDLTYKAGCEDIAMLISLIKCCDKCVTVDKEVYIHNIRNAFSTSRCYSENTYESVVKMYEKRLEMLDTRDKEYEMFVKKKSKQLIWAMSGMFSFPSCNLNKNEIERRFKTLPIPQNMFHIRIKEIVEDKKNLIFWLYQYKFYPLLAYICLIKRRASK